MIFLKDNGLLERDIKAEDIKLKLLGHWGTSYIHLLIHWFVRVLRWSSVVLAVFLSLSYTPCSFLWVSPSYHSQLTLVPGILLFCAYRYTPHHRLVHLIIEVVLVQFAFLLLWSHIPSTPYHSPSNPR